MKWEILITPVKEYDCPRHINDKGYVLKGKTIKIFVIKDDKYRDLKTVELSNWVGKCFIGQRQHLKILKDFEELDGPAVYYLLSDRSESSQIQLYVGEADIASNRLRQHSSKIWWDNFVIFVSKDANLTKSHVRYLERGSYDICSGNPTTINLKNNSTPPGSRLPDSDISDMDDFHENIIFILDHLGIVDFSSASETSDIDYENIFEIKLTSDKKDENGEILTGKMVITESGYRLLKDSYIESKARESFTTHTYYPVRKKLETDGYFKESKFEGCLQLKENIDFPSPSAAASIVKNRATNGKKEWKHKSGMTLADYLIRDLDGE
jgi:hypothetical protein